MTEKKCCMADCEDKPIWKIKLSGIDYHELYACGNHLNYILGSSISDKVKSFTVTDLVLRGTVEKTYKTCTPTLAECAVLNIDTFMKLNDKYGPFHYDPVTEDKG